ncbi:MAG: hypothetical protein KGL43_14340 [Burkholderiales bacterium]|nr:hypothetical protein [Burkholderiales bacterium]
MGAAVGLGEAEEMDLGAAQQPAHDLARGRIAQREECVDAAAEQAGHR